jgi:hypothetical protein
VRFSGTRSVGEAMNLPLFIHVCGVYSLEFAKDIPYIFVVSCFERTKDDANPNYGPVVA